MEEGNPEVTYLPISSDSRAKQNMPVKGLLTHSSALMRRVEQQFPQVQEHL